VDIGRWTLLIASFVRVSAELVRAFGAEHNWLVMRHRRLPKLTQSRSGWAYLVRISIHVLSQGGRFGKVLV